MRPVVTHERQSRRRSSNLGGISGDASFKAQPFSSYDVSSPALSMYLEGKWFRHAFNACQGDPLKAHPTRDRNSYTLHGPNQGMLDPQNETLSQHIAKLVPGLAHVCPLPHHTLPNYGKQLYNRRLKSEMCEIEFVNL